MKIGKNWKFYGTQRKSFESFKRITANWQKKTIPVFLSFYGSQDFFSAFYTKFETVSSDIFIKYLNFLGHVLWKLWHLISVV